MAAGAVVFRGLSLSSSCPPGPWPPARADGSRGDRYGRGGDDGWHGSRPASLPWHPASARPWARASARQSWALRLSALPWARRAWALRLSARLSALPWVRASARQSWQPRLSVLPWARRAWAPRLSARRPWARRPWARRAWAPRLSVLRVARAWAARGGATGLWASWRGAVI